MYTMRVVDVAEKECAILFDLEEVELWHHWIDGREYVSFDAVLRKYGFKEPALLELAKIVRGADANIPDAPPESAALKAIAEGYRRIIQNDKENMTLQFPVYDALYQYWKARLPDTFAR